MKSKRVHVFSFIAFFVAFCAVALIFFSGCTTSDNWVRSIIERYYYRFDGDYSSLTNLNGLTIDEMVEKLDRYSAYYTRDEYEEVAASNAGSKSGIGIAYGFIDGRGALIYSVVGNSPASKAGLKAGDVVVSAKVGEESVKFAEINDFTNFANARTTNENFTLYLENGTEVTLAKTEYTASYACMFTNDYSYQVVYNGNVRDVEKSEGEGIEQLPDGTAYIYLSQFFGGAAEEIAALISIFNSRHCTSLILDLRDNGGGYVDVMAKIGGMFTSSVVEGNAVAMKAIYKDGREEITHCYNYDYEQGVVPAGTDVYVMANHNTASASEALIGVLVSYNILKYENIFLSEYEGFEARSYGKGIMQRTFENRFSGAALKLTVAGIYWQNGVTIHDRGVTVADGCVAAPASDDIVNVGFDDELVPVINKINAAKQQ